MSESNTESLEDKVVRLEETIKDLRSEAAKARVAKRTAVEEAKAQLEADLKAEHEAALKKFQTEQETAVQELNKSKLQVAKLKAALTTVFDGKTVERVSDMASRLVGSTEDELTADAERAKSLFGLDSKQSTRTPAVDPSQALGNKQELPLNGDPLLAAVTNIVNKGR